MPSARDITQSPTTKAAHTRAALAASGAEKQQHSSGAGKAPEVASQSKGPVDPRLLKLSRPTRRWILLAGLVTALKTLCTVALGLLVGLTVSSFIEHPELPLAHYRAALIWLFIVVIARGVLAWIETRFAERAAAQVIIDLRARTLTHLAYKDPRTVDVAAWRTTLSEGIEGIGPYLTGFIPALASTVIATPVMLLVIWWLDTPSLLIALVTLPLIPFFMWLVGTLTAGRTEKRLRDLAVLSDQIMDLVAGLPTLRIFGRQKSTVSEVRRLSAKHTESTMGVLKIAFLSSFVLEFLANLSVALMAVGIGFRLLDGAMTLAAGLTVLIIAPEAYNPIREVGTRFHDAQDGLAATDRILGELSSQETPVPAASPATSPAAPEDGDRRALRDFSSSPLTVVFANLSARGRDGNRPHNLSGTAEPGKITVLAGDNGSGKSTALLALLGFVTEGVSGKALVYSGTTALSHEELWNVTAYLPQRPVLDETTVGDYAALSLGQRQRVAFAAEMQRNTPLVVCDEPTAHLDYDNALTMLDTLRARAQSGATVVVASHDPVVLEHADTVITVEAEAPAAGTSTDPVSSKEEWL